MELTYIALNRAMRLAVALKESPETNVSRTDLPATQEQDRLRLMRDAIEHRESPIKANLAGVGKTIALSVRENESTIEDATQSYIATHDALASWLQRVHAFGGQAHERTASLEPPTHLAWIPWAALDTHRVWCRVAPTRVTPGLEPRTGSALAIPEPLVLVRVTSGPS